MKRVHNFNAGPCVLPKEAINAAIEHLKNFKDTGMSVIEVSHRSKEWDAIMNETEAIWKELLNIPEGYKVLFLRRRIYAICYGFFQFLRKKAAYLETVFGLKAIKEAKGFGEVITVASSAEKHLIIFQKDILFLPM